MRFTRVVHPFHTAGTPLMRCHASAHSDIRVFLELSGVCGTFSMMAAPRLLQLPLGVNVASYRVGVGHEPVRHHFESPRFLFIAICQAVILRDSV
jgi:hypothetical protein